MWCLGGSGRRKKLKVERSSGEKLIFYAIDKSIIRR
jgi:hypothetical protein